MEGPAFQLAAGLFWRHNTNHLDQPGTPGIRSHWELLPSHSPEEEGTHNTAACYVSVPPVAHQGCGR
jgi:hypothetical protein